MTNHVTRARVSGAILAVAMLLMLAGGAAARDPRTEILLEGGATLPQGDLSDDYFEAVKGFGAETGYEAGFLLRYHLTPTWSIGPSFLFTEFGAFTGVDETAGALEVTASALRYGLDVQYIARGDRHRVRPFARAGIALYRNRIKQESFDLAEFYEDSINTVGLSLGGGLRLAAFELGVHYHLNRFETAKFNFVSFPERLDFDWDYVSVRLGFAFPAD